MSMEKARDAGPGPSREELRQAVRSKVTDEAVSATPTPQQIRDRAENDARVAELRRHLGLEPELSHRPGVQDGKSRPEKEGSFVYSGNGFYEKNTKPLYAPRTAQAHIDKRTFFFW